MMKKSLIILLIGLFTLSINGQESIIPNLGHSDRISAVSISPNNKYIVSAGWDNVILLWNVSTGKVMKVFTNHTSFVNSLDFSPDGKRFVSASEDETVKIWDIESGKEVKTLSGHTDDVFCVAYGPNGKYILSGGQDSKVKMWDAEKGELIKTMSGHWGWIRSVAFSSDGERFASAGGYDKKIIVWDTKTMEIYKTFEEHEKDVFSIAFSPDGKNIASTDSKGHIKIWRIKKLKVQNDIHEYDDEWFRRIAYHPNGEFIYGVGEKTICMWEVKSGRRLHVLSGHSKDVSDIEVSADGNYLVSVGYDKAIIMWNTKDGSIKKNLKGNLNYIMSGAASPNGNYLVSGGTYENILMWDGLKYELMRTIRGFEKPISSLYFTSDSRYAISQSWEKIRLWNPKTGINEKEFNVNKIRYSKFSNNGNYFATYPSNEKYFTLSDRRTGMNIKSFIGHSDFIQAIAFSPDSKYISSATRDHKIFVYDIGSRELKRIIELDSEVNSILFSPKCESDPNGGEFILASTGDYDVNGIVTLIKTETGEVVRTMKKHTGQVMKIAFSPDGKYYASAGNRGDLRIIVCETRTGKHISTLKGHYTNFSGLYFGPNNKKLISFSEDGTIKIWDFSKGSLIATLAAMNNFEDWIIYTPDGYWTGSNNCGNYVSMVKGLTIWNIDQFAVKNNRPDIILQRLGANDKDFITHFNNQYKKRIRKLGLTEQQLESGWHTPEAKILSSSQEGANATLEIQLSDSKYALKSYNIFVNDVPVYAQGKPIHQKSITLTEKIELTNGENKIEVSCTNERAIESFRDVVVYDCKKNSTPDLYFIGFGVSKYKNQQLNLKYAHQDALDLEKTFKSKQGKGFKNVYTKVFINGQVTVENIKAAKEFLKSAKPDDTFVLFIAGHGLHDADNDATYYYLTYNTDLNNLSGSAAKFEFIEDLLQEIPPRNKLFLMDACESGETDPAEDYYTIYADAGNRGLKSRGFKSKAGMNSNNSTPKRKIVINKNRFIYNDLLRRSGAIVFSSSRGQEYSYEFDELQNGLFSEFIIKALTTNEADTDNDGTVSTDELRNYVSKEVSAFSSSAQNPTVDRDNIYQKFGFGVE